MATGRRRTPDRGSHGLLCRSDHSRGYRIGHTLGGLRIRGPDHPDGDHCRGGLAAFLAAPPSGYAYRLHRYTADNQAASVYCMLSGNSSSGVYGTIPANAAAGNAGSDNLMGQLCNEALNVQAAGSAGAVRHTLTYDTVRVPSIT